MLPWPMLGALDRDTNKDKTRVGVGMWGFLSLIIIAANQFFLSVNQHLDYANQKLLSLS